MHYGSVQKSSNLRAGFAGFGRIGLFRLTGRRDLMATIFPGLHPGLSQGGLSALGGGCAWDGWVRCEGPGVRCKLGKPGI